MSRRWDIHDFNDPDDDPVTRFRHLGGDYGPYDPAFAGFDDFDNFDGFDGDIAWDSDDSFSDISEAVVKFFEEDQKNYPRNSKDKVRRTPAGPFISLYDTRYFVPQWDEQMLGPPWRQKRGKWDFDNPPKPLPLTDPKMKGAFKYCEHCQLTWLVGYDKLEGHRHPEHLAWDMDDDEAFDIHRFGLAMETSLVIYVHGASVPAGKPSKSPARNLAGFGVYFGEGSKYNQALPCGGISSPQDAEMAELTAVDFALAIMKTTILRDRKILLREFGEKRREAKAKEKEELAKLIASGASKTADSSDLARPGSIEIVNDDNDDEWEDDESDDGDENDLDKLPFRVIIVSDKIQVVDNVCKYYKVWKEEKGKLISKKGKPIKHGDLYKKMIFSQLEDDLDVVMKWYCVPKDQNKGAAKLAMEALEGRFVGYGAEDGYEPVTDEE